VVSNSSKTMVRTEKSDKESSERCSKKGISSPRYIRYFVIGVKCTIYRNMELFGNLSFSSRHRLLVLLPSFTSSSLFSAFAKECVRWRLILYYTMFAFPPASSRAAHLKVPIHHIIPASFHVVRLITCKFRRLKASSKFMVMTTESV
jgi:hypothetical protein